MARQATSCAEPTYKLRVCGHYRSDGDGDGIPCEASCGQNQDRYRAFVKATWPRGLANAVNTPNAPTLHTPLGFTNAAQSSPGRQATVFACQGKHTCREMVSCDEARFYLTQCGVPCNRICGR
ncbi:MAG: excalibur calcium-binding domain-containing protein [Hyphomicrobiaceae bacterium]|nr:excalibur calcium-binding domain-containing protein [Hyphomicrobiaceae bacterium]